MPKSSKNTRPDNKDQKGEERKRAKTFAPRFHATSGQLAQARREGRRNAAEIIAAAADTIAGGAKEKKKKGRNASDTISGGKSGKKK